MAHGREGGRGLGNGVKDTSTVFAQEIRKYSFINLGGETGI